MKINDVRAREVEKIKYKILLKQLLILKYLNDKIDYGLWENSQVGKLHK